MRFKPPKQKQHVRNYKSGKRTLVNKGKRKLIVKKKTTPPAMKMFESTVQKLGGKVGSHYTYPLKKGFLIRYLAPIDMATNQRWVFYIKSISQGKITNPIPKIKFSTPNPEATLMLKRCVNYGTAFGLYSTQAVEELMDWILWGFNSSLINKPPRINEKLNRFWYENFNLGLLMQHPADYMAWMLQEYGHKGGPGWFATPIGIAQFMNEKVAGGTDPKPWQSVCDMCVGTGSILLPASNYSLNIYAQDVSLLMVKAFTINGYLYVPWVIRPFPEYMLNNLKRDYHKIKRIHDGKRKKSV